MLNNLSEIALFISIVFTISERIMIKRSSWFLHARSINLPLKDRTYEHQASSNNSVTVGQGYSTIAWLPDKPESPKAIVLIVKFNLSFQAIAKLKFLRFSDYESGCCLGQ